MNAEPPSRARTAQGPPDPGIDLRRFPVRLLPASAPVYRAHRRGRGPWWFGSDGTGRFDLSRPRGTCYFADTAVVAVRERLGVVLGGRRRVPAAALGDVVVSRLSIGERRALGNLRTSRAADFGVLNELATMVPYDVPRAWASALDAAGLDGVRYAARFTPGRAGSIALFGAGGDRPSWPVDPTAQPAAEVPGAPVQRDPPRRAELTVLGTPRRRAGRTTRPG